MNGVKASFYRQRRGGTHSSNRKEYSKDNAISNWYLISIQCLQFRIVISLDLGEILWDLF